MANPTASEGADDSLEFLEEEQGSHQTGEGDQDTDQGTAQEDGQAQTEHVEEARLAEGGEANDGEQRQEAQGEGKGEQGKQGHPGKKSWRQRQDQYQRAARRANQERDFAIQQLSEMHQRLAAIENTALDTRLLTIDGQLQECQSDADQALTLETQALSQGDQDSVRSARLIRERALSKANVLQAERTQLKRVLDQRAAQPPRTYQPPMPGQAEINQLAARFKADKPWLQFRQDGAPANRETAVLHAIDLAMQAEGQYTADDPQYWAELNRRGTAALPYLFGTNDEGGGEEVEQVQPQQTRQAQAQRVVPQGKPVAKGPAVAGSGRQANAGAPTARLSPQQVDALRDLGLWGNHLNPAEKKEQAEYIKYFQKANRENGAN